jgi:hypothetical protein
MIKGLELLKSNHAGAMLLKSGLTANYGVIRINNRKLLYFTGKGLREIWSPNLTAAEKEKASSLRKIIETENNDETLKASALRTDGYIDEIDLDDIERVIF